jgi:hypothetical protein
MRPEALLMTPPSRITAPPPHMNGEGNDPQDGTGVILSLPVPPVRDRVPPGRFFDDR